MRNYVQEGDALDLIAPSGGVVAGKGYSIDGLFVIAAFDAAVGETFVGHAKGVFELTKLTHATDEALTAGGKVYYDDTNKRTTATATGNRQIGIAIEAAASTAATAKVILVPHRAAPVTAIAAVATTAPTNSSPYGFAQAQAAAILSQLNLVIAALKAHGISLN
jgi:predicted RecA/RadA family phage recombinase